jgi:hypothetical protein
MNIYRAQMNIYFYEKFMLFLDTSETENMDIINEKMNRGINDINKRSEAHFVETDEGWNFFDLFEILNFLFC